MKGIKLNNERARKFMGGSLISECKFRAEWDHGCNHVSQVEMVSVSVQENQVFYGYEIEISAVLEICVCKDICGNI